MKLYYGCTNKDNPCDKKNECERYNLEDGQPSSTLWKISCNESNNYELYIEIVKNEIMEEENNTNDNNTTTSNEENDL